MAQAASRVGGAGDAAEVEADAVAARVIADAPPTGAMVSERGSPGVIRHQHRGSGRTEEPDRPSEDDVIAMMEQLDGA